MTKTYSNNIVDSIFILDWDNTLFSTAYLKKTGFKFDSYFLNPEFPTQDNLIDCWLIKDISSLEEVRLQWVTRYRSS